MYPEELAEGVGGQAVGGSSQEGGRVEQRHLHLQQAQLSDVLEADRQSPVRQDISPQLLSSAHHGEVLGEGAHGLDGHEEGEELLDGGRRHSEPQRVQDQVLHAAQLLPAVGAVGGVHEVVQVRGVHLLVLPTGSISGWDVSRQRRVKAAWACTYAAIINADVPTSCSLSRLTPLVWDRKRST